MALKDINNDEDDDEAEEAEDVEDEREGIAPVAASTELDGFSLLDSSDNCCDCPAVFTTSANDTIPSFRTYG